jgi:hypothetical protein
MKPAQPNLTHNDLVQRAIRWLLCRCNVVISEMVSASPETADAIGFNMGKTILIEAKSSRADFFKDRYKFFRRSPEKGMGSQRYYITAPCLVSVNELPEGWGLLELRGSVVKVIRQSACFPERNMRSEQILMTLAIRRTNVNSVRGLHVKLEKKVVFP